MTQRMRKFFALIQVELEDLVEDVNHSIQLAGYKHKMNDISDKIYKENLTVYHSQLAAFQEFGKIVNEAKNKKFESIQEIRDYLKERFKLVIEGSGYVERAMYFIDRKFGKILSYMDQMEP